MILVFKFWNLYYEEWEILLCHRMGEKIMKDDQGLGRYLNGTDLQLIAPAEIKEVAAG